jgi:phospholipase D1/2
VEPYGGNGINGSNIFNYERYFCITSEAVMYSKGPNEDNSNIREVLNFDHNFSVLHGKVQAGNQLHIILQSTTRKLVLSAPNIFCYIDFLARLKEAIKVSPYTQLHRFDSFAPIRMGQTQWYSDGKGYFSDMYAALQQAT